ncbi:hypothetical protein HAX54_045451 [Datura stramonium]|uniref:Disease resistance protein winged helix domain-containing protein n=1 Tax=Datura stramonium TaxID=4076 RepID=A0ABS8SQB2_DATST|nr:hypothetical protein [Datura stramonium]
MDKKEHCWEQVATNISSQIQDQLKGTIHLSYQNLPNHLRPCFLYFRVFSEGREIQVSKLTWLWISESFVATQTKKPLEDISNDYLENLVGRNLITIAKKRFDVQGLGGRVSVPDTIWEIVKLQHLHIYDQAFFTLNDEEESSESSSILGDLQTISSVYFSCVKNADKILEKKPNLRKLRCEVSKFDGSFPAIRKLKKA